IKNSLPGPSEEQFSLPTLQCISPLLQTVEETREPIPAKIKGYIPEWINGNLLRNGPGKFEFGEEKYNHWFDGMALLHQFQLKSGTVTYQSKFLQSNSYLTNNQHNRIVVSEFGTLAMPDPCKSVFARFMSRFDPPKPSDNANVSYAVYKGDYYVTSENNCMFKVDPETLEMKEKVDWSKFVAVNGATAHPHYAPDGTAYNMGNSYGKFGTTYNIIEVPPQKSNCSETLEGTKVLCSIAPMDNMKPSYYHSFGMSENYIIFIEQPIKLDLLRIITSKFRGKPISEGDVYKRQMDDGKTLSVYKLQNMRKSGADLDQVWCTHENLHPDGFEIFGGLEFPQINYSQYSGRRYRYFYGCGFRHFVGDSLMKVDVETKNFKIWKEDGSYPSEPVFVPVPNATAEDSGVILSVVISPD
ncbi:UNVERIFIED_CONTAM: hypothetical protein H355_010658, partial [Colinus virginianus]